MSKRLQGFGTVLYDELEQIAIRRAGMASLGSTRRQIDLARSQMMALVSAATDPSVAVATLADRTDPTFSPLVDTLARAVRVVRAIEDYADVVSSRCDVALSVVGAIHKPARAAAQPVAFHSIVGFLGKLWGSTRPPEPPGDWQTLRDGAQTRLTALSNDLRKPRQSLHEVNWQAEIAQAHADQDKIGKIVRLTAQTATLDDLAGAERQLADEVLAALAARTGGAFHDQTLKEQLIRGAILWRAARLSVLLGESATGGFGSVIAAYRKIRAARNGVTVELDKLLDSQSVESRFEIGDVIADGARAMSLHQGSVGLAFSGGGIRSATFNLGFLQGMASLRLLKQFDYLSTVSGGGYIGAWLAAWLRREGGAAGEPQPPDPAEVDRLVQSRLAKWRQNQSRAELAQEDAPAKQRDAGARIRSEVGEKVESAFQTAVLTKRDRLERALSNVETQLNPRRAVQGLATRRWVTPQEIHDGREGAQSPPPPLRRVVEEEPQPIYHLRAFSNYLAPKLGLTSLDTWTMISVYLRNLFLNQFILLPMMLAAIALPRLVLIFYANLTRGPAIGPVERWLSAHPWWPSSGLLLVGLIALLTGPKLADFVAREAGQPTRLQRLEKAIFWLMIPPTSLVLWLISCLVFRLVAPTVAPGSDFAIAGFDLSDWPGAGCSCLILALIGILVRKPGATLVLKVLDRVSERVRGWTFLIIAGLLLPSLGIWLPKAMLATAGLVLGLLTGDWLVFLLTLAFAWLGFHRIYRTVALIHASRQPITGDPREGLGRFDLSYPILWEQILVPLALVAFGVCLLFSSQASPIFDLLPDLLTTRFGLQPFKGSVVLSSVCFGLLIGLIRVSAFLVINTWDQSRDWREFEKLGRATAAFVSGSLPCMALAAALYALHNHFLASSGELAAVMMTFGPLLVLVSMGAGSAIEVGLIGDYGDEDMREWRASLGAYLLMIGLAWTVFAGLSLYGPFLLWKAQPVVASAAGAGWALISSLGALAGRSARTDGEKGHRNPLEYVAIIAPPVFVVGLILAIAWLATRLQQVVLPASHANYHLTDSLNDLANLQHLGTTWIILVVAAWVATIGCSYVNINLFSLNAFYANRLVRCYLGASRPREAARDGRSHFAPTNCPVPVRRPNPITGFDPTDDFPLRDLAIVRDWDQDLVVDYPGPYHLINTALNLVAGSDLAWQERMAESFILTPLYCGSKTTGYRATSVRRGDLTSAEVEPDERDLPADTELPGFGGSIRLGTAISVSGAAASPNAGYHSSPLVTILLTVFNARLGLWFGNPARDSWRKSGPGFALYLVDELLGRTTDQGKYVYLSDGGHFENLGVYELVRRRCRYIIMSDAGADPDSAFWYLGGLVRKCREDFGVRIELDISPLLKPDRSSVTPWHCVVGKIHYADVDEGAAPGTLIYVKPTLTGDEPSDVRNYVVDHPKFPHESTADQFFSESQFESYRVLGEHIATHIFAEATVAAGPQPNIHTIFTDLEQRWSQPPP